MGANSASPLTILVDSTGVIYMSFARGDAIGARVILSSAAKSASLSGSGTSTRLVSLGYCTPGSGGNENGLCESGETCVYQPNFGAYAGEGALIGPCHYDDRGGPVTAVTLYAHETNGH